MVYSFTKLIKHQAGNSYYYLMENTGLLDDRNIPCSREAPDIIEPDRLYQTLTFKNDMLTVDDTPERGVPAGDCSYIIYDNSPSLYLNVSITRDSNFTEMKNRHTRHFRIIRCEGDGIYEFNYADTPEKVRTFMTKDEAMVPLPGTIMENKEKLVKELPIEFALYVQKEELLSKNKFLQPEIEQAVTKLKARDELKKLHKMIRHPIKRTDIIYSSDETSISMCSIFAFDPIFAKNLVENNREMFDLDSMKHLLNMDEKEVKQFKNRKSLALIIKEFKKEGTLDKLHAKELVEDVTQNDLIGRFTGPHHRDTRAVKRYFTGTDIREQFNMEFTSTETRKKELLTINIHSDGSITLMAQKNGKTLPLMAEAEDKEAIVDYLNTGNRCKDAFIPYKYFKEDDNEHNHFSISTAAHKDLLMARVQNRNDIARVCEAGWEIYYGCKADFVFKDKEGHTTYMPDKSSNDGRRHIPCTVFINHDTGQYMAVFEQHDLKEVDAFSKNNPELTPDFDISRVDTLSKMVRVASDKYSISARGESILHKKYHFSCSKDSKMTPEQRFRALIDYLKNEVPGTPNFKCTVGLNYLYAQLNNKESINRGSTFLAGTMDICLENITEQIDMLLGAMGDGDPGGRDDRNFDIR